MLKDELTRLEGRGMKEGVRKPTKDEVRGDEWEQSPAVSFSNINHRIDDL